MNALRDTNLPEFTFEMFTSPLPQPLLPRYHAAAPIGDTVRIISLSICKTLPGLACILRAGLLKCRISGSETLACELFFFNLGILCIQYYMSYIHFSGIQYSDLTF